MRMETYLFTPTKYVLFGGCENEIRDFLATLSADVLKETFLVFVSEGSHKMTDYSLLLSDEEEGKWLDATDYTNRKNCTFEVLKELNYSRANAITAETFCIPNGTPVKYQGNCMTVIEKDFTNYGVRYKLLTPVGGRHINVYNPYLKMIGGITNE